MLKYRHHFVLLELDPGSRGVIGPLSCQSASENKSALFGKLAVTEPHLALPQSVFLFNGGDDLQSDGALRL